MLLGLAANAFSKIVLTIVLSVLQGPNAKTVLILSMKPMELVLLVCKTVFRVQIKPTVRSATLVFISSMGHVTIPQCLIVSSIMELLITLCA